jgi:UDP-N-acetylmuramate dehydrogenase
VCASVEAIHLHTGERVTFTNNECAFGYRESVFKHKYTGEFMITSVTYCLTKEPHFRIDYGDIKQTLADMQVFDLTLKAVSDAVIKIRSSKLPNPKLLGNAGSFFKNPVVSHQKAEELLQRNPVMPSYPVHDGVKIPAGWLIEQCGWKGKVVGNTGSHKSQALVLVNYGNATGNEIYQLALDIKHSVFDKFGVEINPEVNIV